jgi:RNA polymerase sigma factor (TIGR02999 family)
MTPTRDEVTRWLLEWRAGDTEAVERWMPAVYDELRRIARRLLRHEWRGHTLQPTELVHEAYFRLEGLEMTFRDRGHFFAVAARFMRRILVDAARKRQRLKRGEGHSPLSLPPEGIPALERPEQLLALEDALKDLETVDRRKSQLIEVRYFGGLTLEETAALFGVSRATVERELVVAKGFLGRLLAPPPRSSQARLTE